MRWLHYQLESKLPSHCGRRQIHFRGEGRSLWAGRAGPQKVSSDAAGGSRQALPSLLFYPRPALPWGSSQDSMPRATLCTEGRRRTGRKGYTAYSTSESESVKTTVSETWVAHSQKRLPRSEETSSGPQSAQENPKCSGCLLLFQISAPCCSSSMLPAGSTLCPAPVARAKSNSSTWRQHGNRKPLLGCMLWDKSLNLLDFNLFIHKIVTH